MDELKLIRDRARGDRIRAMTHNDEFKAVLKGLEQEYFARWVNTQAHERDYREQIYRQMTALHDTIRHLEAVARGGTLAKKQLDLLQDQARRNAG